MKVPLRQLPEEMPGVLLGLAETGLVDLFVHVDEVVMGAERVVEQTRTTVRTQPVGQRVVDGFLPLSKDQVAHFCHDDPVTLDLMGRLGDETMYRFGPSREVPFLDLHVDMADVESAKWLVQRLPDEVGPVAQTKEVGGVQRRTIEGAELVPLAFLELLAWTHQILGPKFNGPRKPTWDKVKKALIAKAQAVGLPDKDARLAWLWTNKNKKGGRPEDI